MIWTSVGGSILKDGFTRTTGQAFSSTQQPVFVTLGPAVHRADVVPLLVGAEAPAVAPDEVV